MKWRLRERTFKTKEGTVVQDRWIETLPRDKKRKKRANHRMRKALARQKEQSCERVLDKSSDIQDREIDASSNA